MNSFFLTDGYKTGHLQQYPKGTTMVFSNFTPRSDKYAFDVCKNKGVVVFRINSYEDLWELNQLHDVYKYNNKNAIVTIPNLFTSQEDRRFDTAQPFGLKLVLEFLKGMENFDYKIFHPHNSEVVEAILYDRVEIIDNHDFINDVFFHISNYKSSMDFVTKRESFIYNNDKGIQIPNNLVVLLPDGGAYKWGVKLMDKLGFNGDVVAASKNRQYVDGKSKLVQQLPNYDFNGKDILIIDDLIIGGATFVGLAKLLKNRNCGKLYLAVSHITVENLGNDPVTNYFDMVYTTNSKFSKYWDKTDRCFSIRDHLKIINLF